MTVVVSRKLGKEDVDALLNKVKGTPKAFDAKKYFGKVEVKGDPLKIQQEMRDE